jgi:hypothetical protein
VLVLANSLSAQDTLVYSFENGDLEGFGPNGAGITVEPDTIGATEGTGSMKVAMTGPTFVGALTGLLHPDIGDPPGLDHVTFDLTLTDPFPEGGFAVVGVMIFAVTQEGAAVQLQTGPSTDPLLEFHIDGLEPGTYEDVTIDMTRFTHPVTFEPGSFNDIVGIEGSGPSDIIPTGFQLYFNKTGGLGFPLTVYIDNIRVGTSPAGVPGDYNNNGTVDAADYVLWRDGGPLANEVADPNVVSPADYDEWRARFGNTMAGGRGSSLSAVPEPASILLLLAACGFSGRRGIAGRRKLAGTTAAPEFS